MRLVSVLALFVTLSVSTGCSQPAALIGAADQPSDAVAALYMLTFKASNGQMCEPGKVVYFKPTRSAERVEIKGPEPFYATPGRLVLGVQCPVPLNLATQKCDESNTRENARIVESEVLVKRGRTYHIYCSRERVELVDLDRLEV